MGGAVDGVYPRLCMRGIAVLAACGMTAGCLGTDEAFADVAGDVSELDAHHQGLGPPYPIVLAHGFFGTDSYLDAIDYWWGVQRSLESSGESLVFITAVDPFNSSEVRGGQLVEAIEAILAVTGHAKVHIIGHSQGGLDARVAAHTRPDLVASVVSLATPHFGSLVADLALGFLDNPFGQGFVSALASFLGPVVYDRYDEDSDVFKSLYQFSSEGIAAFNDAYPSSSDVPHFSVAGRSDLTSHRRSDCQSPDVPDFVARWDSQRDPIDPLLSHFEHALDGNLLATWPNYLPNDGLVRAADAQWGTFLGCIPADHLDQVGQLFGTHPGCSLLYGCNRFDYRAFFTDLTRWLRTQEM
jgi:triacylglycerol lipase